jgi:ubiquinone/menaquinone biosynthesis C-methylase UbiE
MQASARILDIGTGPGKLPELFVRQDKDYQITGIDISNTMIAEAKKRVVSKNVRFQLMQANAPLKYKDEQFDIVCFCSVLFLLKIDQIHLLMNEALRVLKPNGKIMVLTPNGRKTGLSIIKDFRSFPHNPYNWTYLIWKIATTGAGRRWQSGYILSGYAQKKQLRYLSKTVFNNHAILETLTKTI